MSQPVWSNVLDGVYELTVTRIDRNTGRFTITNTDTKTELLNEITPLAYGAPFGADIEDVQRWEDKGIEIVDALYKLNG